MTDTPTYNTWKSMLRRCTTPNNPNFKRYYGSRGITVCDRWRKFSNFIADMGLRPQGMELDRIDNSGNYEPQNCRWADRRQQVNNSARTKPVYLRGELVSTDEACRRLGVHKMAIFARMKRLGETRQQATDHLASVNC